MKKAITETQNSNTKKVKKLRRSRDIGAVFIDKTP